VALSFISNQTFDIANWQHIPDMPTGAIVAPVRRMTSLSGVEMRSRPSQICKPRFNPHSRKPNPQRLLSSAHFTYTQASCFNY
jgi:hypothetical protein